MEGVQDNRIENINNLRDNNDEELTFLDFINTLKVQIKKLETNQLVLSDLNMKTIELHETQREEMDKLLELQRSIKKERFENIKIRDEMMQFDQCIHLKEKVVSTQDLDLLETAGKINNAFNNYLNALNIKLKFKQKCVLNEKTINFGVIVNTTEACLAYDILSGRFDLISLHPSHVKFDQIRSFLMQSGDISGLLASLYLWSSAQSKIDELNS